MHNNNYIKVINNSNNTKEVPINFIVMKINIKIKKIIIVTEPPKGDSKIKPFNITNPPNVLEGIMRYVDLFSGGHSHKEKSFEEKMKKSDEITKEVNEMRRIINESKPLGSDLLDHAD